MHQMGDGHWKKATNDREEKYENCAATVDLQHLHPKTVLAQKGGFQNKCSI
jgi:hypothetical protein